MNNGYTIPYNALRNTDYDLLPETQDELKERDRKSWDKLTRNLSKFLKRMDETKRVSDETYYSRVTI